MADDGVPTLHDWVGGNAKLEGLFRRFYERVRVDAVLAPVFSGMNTEHHKHVAAFVAECLAVRSCIPRSGVVTPRWCASTSANSSPRRSASTG